MGTLFVWIGRLGGSVGVVLSGGNVNLDGLPW